MAPKTIAALMLDTLVLSAGCQLRAQASPLAEAVVACEFHQHPSLRERYGPVGSMRLREDTVQHLSYLADALDAHSPALFNDYIGWVKVLMLQRGVASEDLVHHLECMAATVQALPPGRKPAGAGRRSGRRARCASSTFTSSSLRCERWAGCGSWSK